MVALGCKLYALSNENYSLNDLRSVLSILASKYLLMPIAYRLKPVALKRCVYTECECLWNRHWVDVDTLRVWTLVALTFNPE